jgi:hypothetical protein
MKQKDIAVIVAAGLIAAIFSLILTQVVFVPKDHKELKAEVIDPISSEFTQPDKSVFNQNAINPTQLIQIGDGTNPSPF